MGRILLRLLAVTAIAIDALYGTAAVARGETAGAVLFGIGLAGAIILRHLTRRSR
jgi:hypothetical protein